MSITFNDDQKKAVDRAGELRLSVVNGGAGVGKTTVVKAIFNKLSEEYAAKVELACPTGKAAARLREASGLKASTIHRMLEYNGVGFNRATLEDVNVIIDEASMVDSKIMAEIVRRRPKKLVLVGDEAQLQPVDSGAPFHNIIQLRPELVTTLSICYRNSEAIYQAAMAIRKGDRPPLRNPTKGELWECKMMHSPDIVQDWLVDKIKKNEINFSKDIIICPKNGKRVSTKMEEEEDNDPDHGTVADFNKTVIGLLNNRDKKDKWQVGDRIICLKNYSDIDVWNGTTGEIRGIETGGREKGALYVKGDIPFWHPLKQEYVEEIYWPYAVTCDCQHAYALTVHKGQGSQYDKVFFFSRKKDVFSMFNRSLLYTAITRAKKECYVAGDVNAFMQGISKVSNKQTVLQQLARSTNG